MEDQKRSSMLLFLSKYTIKKEDSENLKKDENHIIIENNEDYDSYIIDNDNNKLAFPGCHTNDAPARFLLKLAEHNEEPIDKIFCIVSKDVYNIKLPQLENESSKLVLEKGKTAFDRFSTLIRNEVGPSIEIIPIYYDFDSNNKGIDEKDRPPHIYNQIEACDIGESIYIDYTGGLRDINLLMIALIRYLEFKGIVCKDIIYSNFHSDPKKIHSIRSTYNMFDMINGVSEFVSTGNARQLVDLQKKLENTTNNDNVNNFVSSLQSFSDAIALCNVGSIVDAITSISESINTLEQDISDDIFVQMFKTLIPTVKEKLYIDKTPPSILDLSQWCLDNNMLQQAVTIYNEKILFYYYDHYTEFYNEFNNGQSYDINKKEAKDLWSDFNKYIRNKTLNGGLNLTKIIENSLNDEIRDLSKKYKENFQENPVLLINDLKINHISLWNAIEDIFKTIDPEKNITKNDLLSCIFYESNSAEIKKVKDKYKQIAYITASLDALEKNNKELWQAMKYYHAVKILRNNINHVSGDVGGMNAKMQEYLEEKGLGDIAIAASETFKFKLESKFISDTLEAAIEFSKEICKN